MIGKTLVHYEITAEIGRGGMGEVYQAKDTKLGRDVAIKVLPEEFALDTDRVARFQREAKLLASLNHPNIAAIYGLEESEGIHFLVMELIEGDTLRDRIKSGPIPVEEALKIALQMAEALEAAHEKGVIHRDLKPANIKVTPDGKVKILDFGLAKAYVGDQENMSPMDSPTISAAATQKGVILGTAAYMSPEQARGKPVDRRADIWAFGVVLFEMLTGQTAFQGEDVSVTLASVITRDVNLTLLPPNIHPRVREVINRCLQKEPKKRYSGISDSQYEIEQTMSDPSGVLVEPATVAKARRKVRLGLSWIAAAIILVAIISGVAVWKLKPEETRQVTSFYYELPSDQQLGVLSERVFAVSPDGSQLVYKTDEGLYLRSMSSLDARLISGTEEKPRKPFFSPDGQWIGYITGSGGELKKISINGGAPVSLSTCNSTGFLSWQTNDRIIYADGNSKIMEVSANGGNPEIILAVEGGNCIAPQILPDEKTVMYTLAPRPYKIVVQSLESGERKELFPGDTARYLPTGHIIYTVDRNLFAVPFDVSKLEVTGGPIPMKEGILRSGGAPQYAVSESGTLIYIPRFTTGVWEGRTLVWVDGNGKEEPIDMPPNIYFLPHISPDGTQVAVCTLNDGNIDTFIWNLARETLTRLTFDQAEEDFPLWTPDGKQIVFYSDRVGEQGIYIKSADGTGTNELVRPFTEGQGYCFPGSWSSDGKTLITQELNAGDFYIGALSMEGDRKWEPLVQGNYNCAQPKISPDGQWLAYTSDESGRNEIYVRPYSEVDSGKWQVSNDGGDSVLWSPDGQELYYRSGTEAMAVPVKTNPVFMMENPRVLFEGNYDPANFTPGTLELNPWDISPDGKRFLMLKPPTGADGLSTTTGPRNFVIIVNWFEELKQRVPVD
jgi:serine/threonine protein kinase